MNGFEIEDYEKNKKESGLDSLVQSYARSLQNGISAKDIYGQKVNFKQNYWMDYDVMQDAKNMIKNHLITPAEAVAYLGCVSKTISFGNIVLCFAGTWRAKHAGERIGKALKKHYGENVKIRADHSLRERMKCEYY